jgi:sugar lactone lactonase YvrE
MNPSALTCKPGRRARWLLPALLCLGATGCGGDWEVEFGGHTHHHHDHDHHHHHDAPPDQHADPAPDSGLFLTAGDMCGCGGSADGTGPTARFDGAEGIAADGNGNLYVAERNSSTIRKITPQAVVTTIAGAAGATGNADGAGAFARFDQPRRLAADQDGNVYVADTGNSTIRRVSSEGAVTTVAGRAGVCGSADGNGGGARFCAPQGIALDRHGNLYVTDTFNHTVRRVDAAGAVTTVAGAAGVCGSADGRGGAARFCQPGDIAVDADDNLYVADTANSTVRRITPAGDVRTVAGRAGDCGAADGSAVAARLCRPQGIAVDGAGDLFVADTGNATVRMITPDGAVSTVTGVPGRNEVVLGPLPGGLNVPLGIAVTGSGTLALTSDNLVLKLVLP